MKYSQKYCLVQFREPLGVGGEFAAGDWPLHCTVAGVFALSWTEALHRELSLAVARHTVFQSATTDMAWFGPEFTVKVRLLEITSEIYELHKHMVAFIEKNAGVFNEPHFLLNDFKPHVTIRGDQPGRGEVIRFHQLTLIDMFPGGDHTRRRIIANMPLATL